jgi:hypothetical protein
METVRRLCPKTCACQQEFHTACPENIRLTAPCRNFGAVISSKSSSAINRSLIPPSTSNEIRSRLAPRPGMTWRPTRHSPHPLGRACQPDERRETNVHPKPVTSLRPRESPSLLNSAVPYEPAGVRPSPRADMSLGFRRNALAPARWGFAY